jgi:hypothetical protein
LKETSPAPRITLEHTYSAPGSSERQATQLLT